MARVGTGRYGDFMRRFFGVAGSSPSTGSELQPDIVATVDLEGPVEFDFLQGKRRMYGNCFRAATVGVDSCVVFENPPSSNTLIEVESLWSRGPSTGAPFLRFGHDVQFTPGAFASIIGAIDLRNLNSSVVLFRAGAVVSFIDYTEMTMHFQGGANYFFRWFGGPIILPPGRNFGVRGTAVNQEIQLHAMWTERALQSSELNPPGS